MKKILFVDQLSPSGHVQYNKYWINILNNIDCTYDTIFKENYKNYFATKYLSFEIKNNFYINIERTKSFFLRRYYLFNILKEIRNITKFEKYDRVIFSSFENFSFFLYSIFYNNKNTFAVLHNNLEKLDNKIIFFIIKFISKRVKLISLDENIKKKLDEKGIKTILISHPIPDKFIAQYQNFDEEIYMFSPSKSSIDEEFINKIPKEEEFFEKNKIKVLLRSSEIEWESKNITITKNFFEDKKYIEEFMKSKIILLPYKKNFKNRVSNVFFEGIANEKLLLISEDSFLSNYKKYEIKGVYFYKDLKDLKSKIGEIIKNQYYREIDYSDIKNKFALKTMESQIKEKILGDTFE